MGIGVIIGRAAVSKSISVSDAPETGLARRSAAGSRPHLGGVHRPTFFCAREIATGTSHTS